MDPKKINVLWLINLFVIGIAEIELPDIMVRVLGAIILVALPFLTFSTVKRLIAKSKIQFVEMVIQCEGWRK